MKRPNTVPPRAADVAEEAAGYLHADHAIRSVSRPHRAATARCVLARFAARPEDPFDRGFRRRCVELAQGVPS